MESVWAEESMWAAGLAARLRLLQATCADVSPDDRRKFITEEIERALKGIAAGKKKSHLMALAEKFPAWGAATPETPAAQAPPTAEEDTPQTRFARWLEVVPQLSPEQKAEVAATLREVGIVAGDQTGGTLDVAEEQRARLAMGAAHALHAEQTVKLLIALTEWTLVLDQLTWKIWKQLAPNSTVRREAGAGGDFKAAAGRYLGGDRDVSIEQLAQNLGKSRKVIAALLTAIVPAAERYAAQYFYRFSPDAIKELAQMDKTWGNIEQKCWRKYCELAASLPTPDAVEKEIRNIFVACVEELVLGPSPGQKG